MDDSTEDRKIKRKDWPVETRKKLPADFPEKFDTKQTKDAGDEKRGKGARLHGSM